MALELIHTSAVSGLRPGSSGFCTVAMTTGMPVSLEERLVVLGGYRPAPGMTDSPPSFSHVRIDVGGRTWSVLTAVRAAPPDHSGRPNKLAHHLVLETPDFADAGPAWLLRSPGVVIDRFEGPPRWIPQPRRLPSSGPVSPRRCDAWAKATGDAGWAGALVNAFLLDPSRISCIVHGPEVDPLELIDEAISLLPREHRWRVTFATHFQQPIAGAPCTWRFCLRGTPAALGASRTATGLYLDLDEARHSGATPGPGRFMTLAREGFASWWGIAHETGSELDGSELPEPWSGPADAAGARGRDGADRPDEVAAVSEGRTDPRRAVAEDRPEPGRSRRAKARVLRGAMMAVAALLFLVTGAAVAVLVERFVLDRQSLPEDSLILAERHRIEQQLREVTAERDELRRALRSAEERSAEAAAERRRVELERDELRAKAEHLTAQLQAFDSLSPVGGDGSSGAPPAAGSARGSSPASDADQRPSAPGSARDDRTRRGDPATPRGASSPSTGPAPTKGAAPAMLVPGPDGRASFPASRPLREISSLGVIAPERRALGSLPSNARSLRVEIPPSLVELSQRPALQGEATIISVTPKDSPREDLARVEVEGDQLYLQWIPSTPIAPLRHYFEAIDSALPLIDFVVVLDDGSTLRVHAEPPERVVQLPPRAPTTVLLGFRSPSLRLLPQPSNEWTVSAESTPTHVRFAHRSGSVQMELDGNAGSLRVQVLSPHSDQLDRLERELREMERDRPNVRPEERAFHDADERSLREKIAALRTRIAKEEIQLPAHLPQAEIRDAHLDRAVMRVRLVHAGAAP